MICLSGSRSEVASLARPGGFTTGVSTLNQDLTPKMPEVQRELIPNCKTVAALFNPANPSNPPYVEQLRAVAVASGMSLRPIEFKSPQALDDAFAAMAAQPPEALHVVLDGGIFDVIDRIAAAALAQRLPSFATMPELAQFGGLAAYGPSMRQAVVRAGYLVKRILDGALPADLPVEQPTQLALVVNLKTAATLDVTVPPTLIARADEVIE